MKALLYAVIAAYTMTFLLFGDENSLENADSNDPTLTSPVPSRKKIITRKHSKEKEPPPFDADLYRRDVQAFTLSGEFLYWRVQEGALDYALSMTGTAWGPSECYAQGTYQNATFNGDPGFRMSLRFF